MSMVFGGSAVARVPDWDRLWSGLIKPRDMAWVHRMGLSCGGTEGEAERMVLAAVKDGSIATIGPANRRYYQLASAKPKSEPAPKETPKASPLERGRRVAALVREIEEREAELAELLG